MHFPQLSFAALPQSGSLHPLADGVFACTGVHELADVLGSKCRTEIVTLGPAQFRYHLLLQFRVEAPVGWAIPQTVDNTSIALAPNLLQQPPNLTFAYPELLGCLVLCDRALRSFMQNLKPVPLLLAHLQPVLSHPDPTLSR